MRSRVWGALLLVVVSLPLRAEDKPAARVHRCAGRAEVRIGLKSEALTPDRKLADGVSLNLPDSGQVELLFYADGHHEEVKGPCLVRVGTAGCQVLHGGSDCLVRLRESRREPVLPRGSNLQAVGGSIAGISDPSMVKGVKAKGFSIKLRDYSDQVELEFSQHDGVVTFKLRSEMRNDIRLLLAGQEVKLDADRLVLASLKAGATYELEVFRGSTRQERIPFTVLSPEQEKELADLLSKAQPGDEVIVIDRLESLGLPSLAAQKAESLLKRLEDQDAGLLTFLHHLYKDRLQNQELTENIRQRADQGRLQLP